MSFFANEAAAIISRQLRPDTNAVAPIAIMLPEQSALQEAQRELAAHYQQLSAQGRC